MVILQPRPQIGNNVVMPQDDIMKKFADQQGKNEIAEVLKELFDENKIFMIGDLTKDEIKLATRIYMVAKLKNIEVWNTGLAFFCKLMLSRDRKSRKELLEAIKGYNQPKSLLSKLNPMNWGRQ